MSSAVLFVLLLVAPLAHAQVPDHLQCYKVKDPSAKVQYTADLAGLAPDPGCVIKTPAKMLCVETTKANVAPTPPGAPAGEGAGRFVCYAVKCPRAVLAPVAVTDQFGTRELEPKKAKMLCAPVAPAPSTTTSSTTSTTATSTTSTTLMKAQGEPCVSAAECATGFCTDGVCCETACSSACVTCSPGTGTCSNVQFQDLPVHGTCPNCGLCNGAGSCCTAMQCTPPAGLCSQ